MPCRHRAGARGHTSRVGHVNLGHRRSAIRMRTESFMKTSASTSDPSASHTPPPPLVVVAKGPEWQEDAEHLARTLSLPLADRIPEQAIGVWVGEGRVALQEGGKGRIGPVCVDLVGGRVARQRRESGFRKQPFFRALGLFKTTGEGPLHVVDATAGFGLDAARMVFAGCRVTAIERHPVVAALLENGVQRACADPQLGAAFRENLRLIWGETADVLPKLATAKPAVDVVYLDPMFPERRKKAQVKKEMQLLQRLHGVGAAAPAQSEQALVRVAREVVTQRVVVKRPPHAPQIEAGVSHCIEGDTVRFDVYMKR